MLRHANCTLFLYTNVKLLAYYAPFHQWTSLSYKRSNIHVKSICCRQIWQNFGGDKYLCKFGKEYLNAVRCKFVVYSLQYSETFDVSHVFLPLTIAELSTLKRIRFFDPPCSSPKHEQFTSQYNSDNGRNNWAKIALTVDQIISKLKHDIKHKTAKWKKNWLRWLLLFKLCWRPAKQETQLLLSTLW